MKQHGYSIDEILNMYPYEKDIHIALIKAEIAKQEEEAQRGR